MLCAPSGHVSAALDSAGCKPAGHTDYKSMFLCSAAFISPQLKAGLFHRYYYFSSSMPLFEITDRICQVA